MTNVAGAGEYTIQGQSGARMFVLDILDEWTIEVSSTKGSRFVELDAVPQHTGNAAPIRLQWILSLESAEKWAQLLLRQRDIWLSNGIGEYDAQLLPVEPNGFTRFVLAFTPSDLPPVAELVARAVTHARSPQLHVVGK